MSVHNDDASIEAVPDELAARLREGPPSATLGNCD
jgi:hypothetical protein